MTGQARDDATVGWASRSLDDSLQRAEAVGMGLWQIVMVYSIAMSEVAGSRRVLIAAHLAIFAFVCLTVARRVVAWPILVLMCSVLLFDYRSVVEVDSPLWFACFWSSLLFTAVPVILLPTKRALWLALLALGTTGAALLLWHRDLSATTFCADGCDGPDPGGSDGDGDGNGAGIRPRVRRPRSNCGP